MIYDCFPFFNELDILEIRLNILNDSVDRFVLVESTRTHQGKQKELYYKQNKGRFAKFQEKIIHVVSDTFPNDEMTSWDYERFQRNEIKRALVNCQPEDVILVSDLDEIPDPKSIVKASQLTGIKIFRQKMYYYFLNCSADIDNAKRKFWNGSVMISFKELEAPQDLRNLAIRSMKLNATSRFKRMVHTIGFAIGNLISDRKVNIVSDGGWHFTYMGGAKKIIEKLEAFAHTELNTNELKNNDRILQRINEGKSVFGDLNLKFVQLDNTYPSYILENQEQYAHLIK